MSTNTITVVGNLTADPELRFTGNGNAVVNLAVAANRRVRYPHSNEWEDQLDGYFDVTIWRDYAEKVAESLTKDARVVVVGRLVKRSYNTQDGDTRWTTEIEADEISPSLRWSCATLTKAATKQTEANPTPQPSAVARPPPFWRLGGGGKDSSGRCSGGVDTWLRGDRLVWRERPCGGGPQVVGKRWPSATTLSDDIKAAVCAGLRETAWDRDRARSALASRKRCAVRATRAVDQRSSPTTN